MDQCIVEPKKKPKNKFCTAIAPLTTDAFIDECASPHKLFNNAAHHKMYRKCICAPLKKQTINFALNMIAIARLYTYMITSGSS